MVFFHTQEVKEEATRKSGPGGGYIGVPIPLNVISIRILAFKCNEFTRSDFYTLKSPFPVHSKNNCKVSLTEIKAIFLHPNDEIYQN